MKLNKKKKRLIASSHKKSIRKIESANGSGTVAMKGFSPPSGKEFVSKTKIERNRKECRDLLKEARNNKPT